MWEVQKTNWELVQIIWHLIQNNSQLVFIKSDVDFRLQEMLLNRWEKHLPLPYFCYPSSGKSKRVGMMGEPA